MTMKEELLYDHCHRQHQHGSRRDTDRAPEAGETVLGNDFQQIFGGKALIRL